MSESEPKPESESETEWVKQRISDEEITILQEALKNMQIRLENSAKLLHQRDTIIRQMAHMLESNGINMIVLSRNALGLLDQAPPG